MRAEGDTSWVIPLMDDVAQFLLENGYSECSRVVREASAKVAHCDARLAGRCCGQNLNESENDADNVVAFPGTHRQIQ